MRRKPFFILMTTLIMLGHFSCKKKDETGPDPGGNDYCIKRKITRPNGDSETELMKYRDGKIIYYNSDINRSNYISSFEKAEFFYDKDNLSKMVIYSNDGKSQLTKNYKIENNLIVSFTCSRTGLHATTDNYPTGKYYRDAQKNVIAFVQVNSETQKDSSVYERLANGAVSSEKAYNNGVLTNETRYIFSPNGNITTTRYISYNSSGTATYDYNYNEDYYETKGPAMTVNNVSIMGGYSPGYNYDQFVPKSQTVTNNFTSTITDQKRYTATFDQNNNLTKEYKESYNTSTKQWEFYYQYEYSYVCE